MVAQHYRWDFIGLSTDTKPTPETSEKVVNGSTFYCSDDSKLYVFCDGTWYERKPLGGGGATYTAGEGIDIEDNTISVDTDTIQSKLTAGDNITISDGTIAATDTTYTAGTNVSISEENVISATNTTYTAGTNVSISDANVISATDTTYTAGTNVSISDANVISATDTTYSNFVGTNGSSAGSAGLVPAPATTDSGKFLKADGTWGTVSSGPTVVQTTGTSTSSVMSQDAATKLVYPNISSNANGIGIRGTPSGSGAVSIGGFSQATTAKSVALGMSATATGDKSFAAGNEAYAQGDSSVAIGYKATASAKGEFAIGTVNNNGYNNTNYRLITGVYDPQNAHDAATKGYVENSLTGLITLTSTDPGEGVALAEGKFIGVYS